MKVFAVGDIHGCLGLFNNLWGRIERRLNLEDKVVLLGDYIDRGPESFGVITRVLELKRKYGDRLILLWGNHEQMACSALGIPNSHSQYDKEISTRVWLSNGGKEALASTPSGQNFTEKLAELKEHLVLSHMERYSSDNHPICFVHAAIPVGKFNLDDYKDIAFGLWGKPNIHHENDSSRLMVCGHISQKNYKNLPNLIMIDAGSSDTDKLCAVQLDLENRNSREFLLEVH